MRVIFCGGRDYADRATVERVVGAFDPGVVTIVHGAARGADALVEDVAAQIGFTTEPHPAAWNLHDKAAGMIRNREMLDAGADLVVAFPGGSGTKGMCRIAYDAGIPVMMVYASA